MNRRVEEKLEQGIYPKTQFPPDAPPDKIASQGGRTRGIFLESGRKIGHGGRQGRSENGGSGKKGTLQVACFCRCHRRFPQEDFSLRYGNCLKTRIAVFPFRLPINWESVMQGNPSHTALRITRGFSSSSSHYPLTAQHLRRQPEGHLGENHGYGQGDKGEP